MATAIQAISKAKEYLNIEGTDNIFNTWYWGQHCYDPNIYPWCAAFQSYVANQVGGLGYASNAAASGIFNQLPRVSDADVQPGDYVCFNWDGRSDTSWMDHIAMVVEFNYSSGYLLVIEGNGGYGGGIVRLHEYNNNSSYFTAFCRPNYTGQSIVAQPANAPANIRFRVHSNGEDNSFMNGHTDEGGSSDDFGGVFGKEIKDIDFENLGTNGWFQFTLSDGTMLERNQHNTTNLFIMGVTIYYDTPNANVTGYYRAVYQVHTMGGVWLKEEYDDEDGGAGDDKHIIDAIRITIAKE